MKTSPKILLLVSFILRQHILEALAVIYDADKIDYGNCKLEVQTPPLSIVYDGRIQNKTSTGARSVVTTLVTETPEPED